VKNTAAKGRRNEHRSRDILEAAGYRVTRAAGSLGDWDLVGLSSTDVVLVQVRTRDWPGLIERQALKECVAPPNTRKLLHRYRDGRRRPDEQEL
jgi:Holliday junction resolvase-like predicted endonuclease